MDYVQGLIDSQLSTTSGAEEQTLTIDRTLIYNDTSYDATCNNYTTYFFAQY